MRDTIRRIVVVFLLSVLLACFVIAGSGGFYITWQESPWRAIIGATCCAIAVTMVIESLVREIKNR